MVKLSKWILKNSREMMRLFFLPDAQKMSQTPLVAGMVLGGVVISSLGAASTQFIEEKKPTAKSLGRDFIIGAIMVAMIMQLLPESSSSVVEFIMGLVPLALFTGDKTGVVEAASNNEVEVKVGVPQF